VGVATLLAVGAWIAGSRIESPADAAARTAPPVPSPILVPVEERVLSSNIVTRGKARFGLPQPISLPPSPLKGAPGLLATLPARNTQIHEGGVLLTASGRPVFVLTGKVPAYRDLVPGISGQDVRQLEEALKRLGFDPGPLDGVYDQQTSAAVARWYKSKGWEPFGPTREQLANVALLERDWGEANKNRQAAATAMASALAAEELARAAAEHNVRVAEAEAAARQNELRKPRIVPPKDLGLAVEAERAKAEHANTAAAADVTAQIAERALIVLDPRQPETARAAANAKLRVARAAENRTRIEGQLAIQNAELSVQNAELAMQTSEAEAKAAAQRSELARMAVKAARLEGQKGVRAAQDAHKLAQLDHKLAADRAARIGAELEAARRKLGVYAPVDEIVFIPALPVRVEEVTGVVGAAAGGTILSVTDNQLAIDAALTLEAAPLVKPGMQVSIDEQALGVKATGVVHTVASTPGTRGVDGYHIHCEIRVTETSTRIDGVSLRLTIPIQSTRGAVTAVPVSALSLGADGTSRVQIQRQNGLEYIAVKPGLSADGYVEVMPVEGSLAPGQLVVVGYKNPDSKGAEVKATDGKAPQ
jgi:peptidoglycan hydrolase-like protein with peptidoglycan-binding domain